MIYRGSASSCKHKGLGDLEKLASENRGKEGWIGEPIEKNHTVLSGGDSVLAADYDRRRV